MRKIIEEFAASVSPKAKCGEDAPATSTNRDGTPVPATPGVMYLSVWIGAQKLVHFQYFAGLTEHRLYVRRPSADQGKTAKVEEQYRIHSDNMLRWILDGEFKTPQMRKWINDLEQMI